MKNAKKQLAYLDKLYNRLEKIISMDAMDIVHEIVELEISLEEECNK